MPRKSIITISLLVLIAVIYVLLIQSKVLAQQTIFNVPSADVLDKGQIFLQHESQFSGDFGLFTNYSAYGIGKHTELDITLFGVGTKKIRNEVLGIGFKTSIPIHEKSETKLTFGNLIPISLRGDGVGGYTYSHISTRLPKINTRITSGVFVGTTLLFGRDFVSFIAGIEQPITKRFGIIMDWYSGKHAYGFLTPGFYYLCPKNTTLWAGYQISNNRANGNNGFVIELSRIF
ncbi:MAG: hypothetical protein A3I68_07320 [Candidatus Melainabacteria bacterium RIFCSPLOWO2_02_FULL_35_15]|nr:MAG: hypothetical protein A3F80_03210 [Candidatus Melainabacteria bacterium RIFCSPLOWO2_12_FULL_35_11]OGI12945.1 MAG: hypothetical protein A3I68_07320 [Candidatus Melainabacteria bacterium RIFCSPLOWO2_02_FULL_35_15]